MEKIATLRLARDLELPALELACEVTTFVGNRGGGKTNGAVVAVEQMLDAGVQVVVLDYVGIWYGLRLKSDGKTPSRFVIPILGGRHGDIPLSASAGRVVAEALASRHSPAVLDLSAFSQADRCRFATDFGEVFFQSKKQHRGPSLVVLEESQRYVPQRLWKGQERMYGAWSEIAEVGRNFGIGLFLITQRPQKINKDVLNLSDNVFAFRTNGVHEREAIDDWVQEKEVTRPRDIADQMPTLPTGTCFAWSPVRKIFGSYKFHLKTTYDSGATPAGFADAVVTRPLDLAKLEEAMGEAAREAAKGTPSAMAAEVGRLRTKVAELERSLARKTPDAPATVVRTVAAPVSPRLRCELVGLSSAYQKLGDDVARKIAQSVEASTSKLAELVALLDRPAAESKKIVSEVVPHTRTTPASSPAEHRQSPPEGYVKLTAGQRAVLETSFQYADQGGVSKEMLTVLTGYKRSSRDTFLQQLKALGMLESRGDRYLPSSAAEDAYGGQLERLPAGDSLLEYWRNRLPEGERRVLDVAVECYPEGVEKETIDEVTGYRRSSRDTFLQRLRVRNLVTVAGSTVTASKMLFEEGAS